MIQAHSWLFLLLCVVVPLSIVAAGLGGYWFGRQRHTSNPQVLSGSVRGLEREPKSSRTISSQGPWGEVEYERVAIQTPDECLVPLGSPKLPRWFFKGYTTPQLIRLLADVPLKADEKAELLQTNAWQVTASGIAVSPSTRTVLALSPNARKRIYQVLGEFNENPAQARPFHWLAEDEDALFKTGLVSATTRSELRRLCYARGKRVVFADLEALLPKLPNDHERRELLRLLSCQFGVLLRLNVKAASDIDALLRYWGVGGLGKTLRPALEAAARAGEGRKIPVLGLLPPSMRARLYTFPAASLGLECDAYWTAANFFKTDPVAEKMPVMDWLQKCKTEYHPLGSDPRFGDVLMLTRSDGRLLHACVYLADDVVFTKNGSGPSFPWMMMRVTDLLGYFSIFVPEDEPLRINYLRGNAI